MKVVRTVLDFRGLRDLLAPTTSIGFVSTMGGLHEGHVSLIRRSAVENRFTIVSIFVNPAQFAPGEDLSAYPRTEASDLSKCNAAGADVVFAPVGDEVYPSNFGTYVTTAVGNPACNPCSEGASRPTFFRGVATVLIKLFSLVRPHRTYFGQKDAQQCAVVRQLVRDLWLDMCLIVCPTVREADGLAMSSRNAYLTPMERQLAPVLFHALTAAQKECKEGVHNAEQLRLGVRTFLEREMENVKNVTFELIYVSICDCDTMKELEGDLKDPSRALICTTAMLGKTRLLDNVVLIPVHK